MKKTLKIFETIIVSVLSFVLIAVFGLLLICLLFIYETPEYPPESDWHLTTDELFIEYGQKYVDYIEETIDSYDLEHTFNQELIHYYSNDENCYITTAEFTDGYKLEVYINQSTDIYIELEKDSENPENVYNVKQEYFDMIYKIGQFCIYEFNGNENTFPSLMKKNDDSSDSIFYYSSYRWRKPIDSSNPCEYYAAAFLNDDGETAIVRFTLQAYLTDKNIWGK